LKLLGHNEFAVRFFHGISFLLTSVMVGLLAYLIFGEKRIGLLACLVYATMAVPFYAASFVTPDTLLTLWTTAAGLCFWQSVKPKARRHVLWKMLLCLSVGIGFLAKGPAVLIPCGGMFVFLMVNRGLVRYFINPWSIVGIMIFFVVGLGWYFWVSLRIPGALNYFFDSEIWGRLVSQRYHRNPGLTGALIYVPVLVFGSLPWSIVWLKRDWVREALLNKGWWAGLHKRPEMLFLVTWFFVPLIILSLASSKLGFYALPIFTPLAIVTAKVCLEKIPPHTGGRFRLITSAGRRPVVLVTVWVVLLIISKLGIAYYPTANDMEALSHEINKVLDGDYELGTVDERADGLLFYGIDKVEHVTNDMDSYPSFTPTDHILVEIREMQRDKERGVFLMRGQNDIDETCRILKSADIKFELVRFPHNRAILKLDSPPGLREL